MKNTQLAILGFVSLFVFASPGIAISKGGSQQPGTAGGVPVPPGNGDINSPWQISTADHLLWISQEVAAGNDFEDEHLVQIQNINAGATSTWNPDGSGGYLGFPPIGPNNTESFQGHYDGGGYQIEDLYINRPSQARIGLFGTLGASGSVSNLGVTGLDFTGDYIIGGLVGMNFGLVQQCHVSGTIAGQATMGGLAAVNSLAGMILDSYALVDIAGGYRVGGLVGHNVGSAENVFSAGLVTDATGTWPATIAGLVGENDSTGAIANGFWDSTTSGYSGNDDGVGNETAAQSSVIGLDTPDMQSLASFDGVWLIEGRTDLPPGYPVLQWQIDQDFSAGAPVWLIGIDGPPALPVPVNSLIALLLLILTVGLLAWKILRNRPG